MKKMGMFFLSTSAFESHTVILSYSDKVDLNQTLKNSPLCVRAQNEMGQTNF